MIIEKVRRSREDVEEEKCRTHSGGEIKKGRRRKWGRTSAEVQKRTGGGGRKEDQNLRDTR